MRGIVQKPLLGAESMGDGTSLAEKGNVGYWPMNEGAGGIINDLSVNQNTGTFTSNVSWTSGQNGFAVDGPGATDLIDCGNKPALNKTFTELTVIARIFLDADLAAWDMLMGKMGNAGQRGWQISVETNETLKLAYFDGPSGSSDDAFSTSAIPIAEWVHIAVVFKASTFVRFYFDGNLINEVTAGVLSALNGANTSSFQIFNRGNSVANESFDGLIDHVLIYNHALSAAEIRQQSQTPFIESPGQTELLYVAPVGLSIPIAMHHYKQMAGAA